MGIISNYYDGEDFKRPEYTINISPQTCISKYRPCKCESSGLVVSDTEKPSFLHQWLPQLLWA
jgi:hypothetical protein